MAELRSTLKEKVLRRFIPYVQMHEFEALLFSDPAAFAKGIESPDKAKDFHKIRSLFDTPEDINDGAETAPSKRILKLVPAYEKPIQGSLGAIEVGLTAMRQTCVLFDAWLKQLEALPEGRTAN